MLAADAMTFGLAGAASQRRPVEMLDAPKPSKAEAKQAAAIAAFVRKLPASGSVVVVHSPSVVEPYRRCIRELRGDDVAAETRVIAAPTLAIEVAATTGLKLPVFRDSLVEAQCAHRAAFDHVWRA